MIDALALEKTQINNEVANNPGFLHLENPVVSSFM